MAVKRIAGIRRLERKFEDRDRYLASILECLLTALQAHTESITALRDGILTRLPVWAEVEPDPPTSEQTTKPN
jgi:hypothetical protein